MDMLVLAVLLDVWQPRFTHLVLELTWKCHVMHVYEVLILLSKEKAKFVDRPAYLL